MKKEYGRSLRKLFSRAMKERLTEFNEEKVNSIYIASGERAYSCEVNKSIKLWIVLSPSPKGSDEFTILIGWSDKNRYPELSMIPCAHNPSDDREEFDDSEYLTRLPFLWTDEDEWWVVDEFKVALSENDLLDSMKPIESRASDKKVFPIVEDSINKLIGKGVPYLKEYLNRKVMKDS